MDKKKVLRLSEKDKMVTGLCGGIGEYLGVDSKNIRALLLCIIAFTAGIGMFFYFLFALALMGAHGQSTVSKTIVQNKARHPIYPKNAEGKESHIKQDAYISDDCGQTMDSHVGRQKHRLSNYSEDEYFKESHKSKSDWK